MHHSIKLGVQKFRHLSRLPIFNELGVPPKERIQLCATLCIEEPIETLEAMGVDPEIVLQMKELAKKAVASIDPSRVVMKDVADGLGDSDFVNEWSRCEFGIHGEPVADAIEEANLAKFGPGSSFREDGKVMKPPGWTPPDIQAVLDNQKSVSWVIFTNADRTEMGINSEGTFRTSPDARRSVDGEEMEPLYFFSAPTYDGDAIFVYEYLMDTGLV
jgi:predicted HAD superfamily Cof-like phosphohydrolase